MLTGVVATDWRDVVSSHLTKNKVKKILLSGGFFSSTDLCASEVVCSAGPGCGGRGQAGVHKVQSDSANIRAELAQSVLAGRRSIVGVRET